jgi:hypothetical protein
MDPKSKQEELKKIPMRKLLARVKLDIRKTIRESKSAAKPKKKN